MDILNQDSNLCSDENQDFGDDGFDDFISSIVEGVDCPASEDCAFGNDDGFDSLLAECQDQEEEEKNTNNNTKAGIGATTSKNVHKKLSNSTMPSFFSSQSVDDEPIPTKQPRFSGPAGILPSLTTSEMKCLESEPTPLHQKVSNRKKTSILKSETTVESDIIKGKKFLPLSKAPWRMMLQRLDLNLKDLDCISHRLNIKWIHQIMRFPGTTFVPFVVAVVRDNVEEMDSVKKGVSTHQSYRVFDHTGNIVLSVSSSFTKAFASMMNPGSAIALQNCGFCKYGTQSFLTASNNNLVCLVSDKISTDPDDEPIDCIKDYYSINGKNQELFIIQPEQFHKQKVLQDYQRLLTEMKNHQENKLPNATASSQSTPLNCHNTSTPNNNLNNTFDSNLIFGDFPINDDYNDLP